MWFYSSDKVIRVKTKNGQNKLIEFVTNEIAAKAAKALTENGFFYVTKEEFARFQ